MLQRLPTSITEHTVLPLIAAPMFLVSGVELVTAACKAGIIVLAGAMSSGRDIRAAQVMGADLIYFGTSFIATTESMADKDYQQMLVDATMDDLIYTNAFSGAYANMLKPSIIAAGIDPDSLKPKDAIDFSHLINGETKAWKHIWSAGQGVSFVREIQPTADLVAQLRGEYAEVVAEERRGDAWANL